MSFRNSIALAILATCCPFVLQAQEIPQSRNSWGARHRELSPAAMKTAQRQHAPAANQPVVDDYKITVLSDVVSGVRTAAEWRFAAVIEVTSNGVSRRFLFDTGSNPQTVLTNARQLNVSICDVQDVILSHSHWDHTTGLATLRSTCKDTNPNAFRNAYIGGEEAFWPRPSGATNSNYLSDESKRYIAQGGTFVLNSQPTPQFLGLPGVWLTGKIARIYDERTYPGTPNIQDPDGKLSPDVMPEEIALVINTAKGMVVITGCAHAGITNTILAAQAILEAAPPVTIVGGFHFYPLALGEENTEGIPGTMIWEANQMMRLGVISILGAHCTGFERLLYGRDFLGLDDAAAQFSSVGTMLSMSGGFRYLTSALNAPLRPGWETRLQTLACATKPPAASCQVSVSDWNYHLMNSVSPLARPLVIGDGTQMMTIQQYLAARIANGI
jgi:7,8-dihydropterin-6-yl-methyl-4-(beta-D-ribofuranosyl)aminobenzene 5'-phosphate synthase